MKLSVQAFAYLFVPARQVCKEHNANLALHFPLACNDLSLASCVFFFLSDRSHRGAFSGQSAGRETERRVGQTVCVRLRLVSSCQLGQVPVCFPGRGTHQLIQARRSQSDCNQVTSEKQSSGIWQLMISIISVNCISFLCYWLKIH